MTYSAQSAPAFPSDNREAHALTLDLLAALNRGRMSPRLPAEDWESELARQQRLERAEVNWLELKRAEVREQSASAPTDAQSFVRWFEELKVSGAGQGDRLFPWLEHDANAEEMRWFILQEVAGEAGFEDLVALAQLKLSSRPKLEMARNYWDEMGRGAEAGMHGPMLGKLAEELHLTELGQNTPILRAPLELAHLMSGLAHHRRYAYQSIGALGVIELTAPGRAACVYRGLKRLGVSAVATRYYLLHSTLDVKHSEAWNIEVIAPLVAEEPACARYLAEGALLRLQAGLACFEAYREHFAIR